MAGSLDGMKEHLMLQAAEHQSFELEDKEIEEPF